MSYTDYSSNPGAMGNVGGANPQRDGIVQALMNINYPPPGAAVAGPPPQFVGGLPQPPAPGMPGMPQAMPGLGAGTIAPPMGMPGSMPGGLQPGAMPSLGGLNGATPQPTQQPVTGRPGY